METNFRYQHYAHREESVERRRVTLSITHRSSIILEAVPRGRQANRVCTAGSKSPRNWQRLKLTTIVYFNHTGIRFQRSVKYEHLKLQSNFKSRFVSKKTFINTELIFGIIMTVGYHFNSHLYVHGNVLKISPRV